MITTLATLITNEIATVISCPIKQLYDMGLIIGARIRMVKAGNPCIIEISNIKLAFGYKYQTLIKVKVREINCG